MNKAQMHLSVSELGVPKYRVNPSNDGDTFAVLDLGLIQLFIFDPAELRRLADVAANAADVLEQAQVAQAQARPASRCCDQATHDALRESDAWNRLEFVGYQDDGQGEKLELRNCPCGATLAILARESPSGAEGAGLARVAG